MKSSSANHKRDIQSDGSIFDQGSDTVIFYDHGQFSPVTSDWQRQNVKNSCVHM